MLMQPAINSNSPIPAEPPRVPPAAPAVVLYTPNARVHHLRVCGDSPLAALEMLRQFQGLEVWVRLPPGHAGPGAVIDKLSLRLLSRGPGPAPGGPPMHGLTYLTTMHDRRARFYYKGADAPTDAEYWVRWADHDGNPGPLTAVLHQHQVDAQGRVAA